MNNATKNLIKRVLIFLDKAVTLTVKNIAPKTLLLVRLDAIGDFILWLDTAKEYRRLYPDYKITLIANNVWADLAAELPYWDEVLHLDLQLFARKPLYRWKILRNIHKLGFEVAIQPTFSRLLLRGDSVIRATGALQRIGSAGDVSNITTLDKVISDKWYTYLVPAQSKPLMELCRNAEFVRNLSKQPYSAKLPVLPRLTKQHVSLEATNDYFIIFPAASWHGRQWPIEYFSYVLDKIHTLYGWKPVLCGSSADFRLCMAVASSSESICLNLSGKTSLLEFAEVIRGARLLIANETSAIHFSAAVSTPSVCILGGGHYGRFMPYPQDLAGIKPLSVSYNMPCFGCNWKCNQPHDWSGPVPCIGSVSIEEVLEAAHLAITQEASPNE
ncbi:glycosyltransferase family 9 protein [Methylotenera versatilis]|uniref:glycosyltransferase family 9 protein n=1 Tax=Methylotenera versatilis TaxID=1055487 RepID=UPI00068A33FF|nr:glycosyltransferase family 9 protein [Methylotenera versatilis]